MDCKFDEFCRLIFELKHWYNKFFCFFSLIDLFERIDKESNKAQNN